MRVAMFSTRGYDRQAFEAERARRAESTQGSAHEVVYCPDRLDPATVPLARGCEAVCLFVNDHATAAVVQALAAEGVRLIAIRAAGCDQIDLAACEQHGIAVVRVAGYSPQAIAEHALALLLALERRIHRAHRRTRDLNFSLEGLTGGNLASRRVGVVGTGRIGSIFARMLRLGFGCEVVAFDRVVDERLTAIGVRYVELDALLAAADVVSLHAPLTPQTRHLVNAAALARMPRGAVLVNTSRGGLVDTAAAIAALESGQLGGFALDVYEREAGWFFTDHSNGLPHDPVLSRLLAFPNVLLTGHQAFLTHEALGEIARATFESFDDFAAGRALRHAVCAAL